MMDQLELFKSDSEKNESEDVHEVDFIFEKVGDQYKLVHSFYNSSKIGKFLTAEEVLDSLVFHSNWYYYSAVAFQNRPGLNKRCR